MKRKIIFFVYPEFESLDLTGPCAAFNLANELSGAGYGINVVSATGGPITARAGLSIESCKLTEGYESAGTILVVGGPTAHLVELDADTKELFAENSRHTANRVGSVCTGTFLLAAAGLLNGKRVTTHWRYAGLLQTQYPMVQVDVDRIFIKDGNIWTSAGMTAGIDLALTLIENDFGADLAKSIAREMVVYHRRLGGQSQYSAMLDMTPPSGRIRDVMCYAREHLGEPLSVNQLADVACLSLRQFNRNFLKATGVTPAKAIERLRLDVARPKIEETSESLEKIAKDVGFGTAEKMCRSCLNVFGRTPQELRRTTRKQVSLN
ncbi:GlxA family transcriptional regulator [Candidatus Methylospira mobilis]|uniref:GlxA family transcriptional regulator n=1 Tax=Candidatus Methylospira mobilis TaxID=1808979 RepID=UPI0028EF189E|nr:GlxA family transcriptional regulator [Candidatus Methylospira mobilis]WNV06264.1 GlxA family transcriptional regulator [Candidatus Methylospira mobilis]